MTSPTGTSTLGARPEPGGVRFRLWAPDRSDVRLIIERGRPAPADISMDAEADGYWSTFVPALTAGALYRYRIDGAGPYPDPASRAQPEGVHGPSEVVDPARFSWKSEWSGSRLDDAVIYELHLGTFTPEGTFAAAMAKLPWLRELGVTLVELMPVADFPGRRNWGYDGVSLYAPARCYGRPDELRALVDEAHRLGMGVLLDVVYNHFGPDGAYQGCFTPFYYTKKHHTPWGDAINLDGAHAAGVRRFLIQNALHWLNEYRIDGLRLDATHALYDDGEPHILAELAAACAAGRPDAKPLLIAEDHRNLDTLIRPPAARGYGLDAVWADDLHHQVRRGLAGDHEGYYGDFSGSVADLVTTINQGWFFTGQHSKHLEGPRGTPTLGLTPRQFVVFIQNHDQIGNRAMGERLNHDVDLAAFRAATALLLCLPETPMLFMGQEWAASAPFQFFTDHSEELGRLVTAGRRAEFRGFTAFTDEKVRAKIPDPQAESTFTRSKLDWSEIDREPHASMLRLTRALLALRREAAPISHPTWDGFHATPCGYDALILSRREAGSLQFVLVRLRGAGEVAVPAGLLEGSPKDAHVEVVLSTEDPSFATDPRAIELSETDEVLGAMFARPGALILCRR